ncbi:MAG TPA: PolC-type DNA polymerase III [Symbiobacteriaceae bacterium]
MSPQADWLALIDRTSLPADVQLVLDEAQLLRVEVRQRAQEVILYLEVKSRLALAHREVLGAAVARACFDGLPVRVRVMPQVADRAENPATVLEEAWLDVLQQARDTLPRLNGIMDKAAWKLEGGLLSIEMPTEAMVGVIQSSGGADLLQALIQQETGLEVTVRLAAKPKPPKLEKVAPVAPEDPFAELPSEAVPLPPEPAGSEPEVIAAYFDQWMQRQSAFGKKEGAASAEMPADGVLKGRVIQSEVPVREINSVTEEENRVVIEGEVVGVDSRDTKTGKQMISFSVCDLLRLNKVGDLGDTLPVKVFRDPKKDPEIMDRLKNGAWVRVRGNVQMDKFQNELVLMADDINLGSRPARKDSYEGLKRIELHAHTLMSAMDGMIDPEQLVKRAIAWGHRGVAVMDHGVVQAFPAASHVKAPADFKLLYGCEFYMVDDGAVIIQRPPQGVPLAEADFVVLDIETTGFSPIGDDIIEVGAVRYRNGKIGESFQRFIRPSKPIPLVVQELTHITPDMVANAPTPEEVLPEFFRFIGDAIIVAHNAQFDYSFLRYHRKKHLGEEFTNPVLDTLVMGRSLLPHLKAHNLAALTKELQIQLDNHHRADADARTAAMLLDKLLAKSSGLTTVEDLNTLVKGMNVEQMKPYHVTCLVQKQHGVKNLYKLISKSHIEFFNRTPRLPKTELEKLRDGLLIGSATYGGHLYDALLRGVPEEELEELVEWYDYLEIVPRDCIRYLLEQGQVNSEEQLIGLNQRIYALGKKMGKPVVAVGDAHFLEPHQQVFRRILKGGIGFRDEYDAPFYFRTTGEMLAEFKYLGPEAALEVVVTNTNAIADSIDNVKPVPDQLYPPVLEGSNEKTRELSYAKARRVYGEPLPEKVSARLEKELKAIIGNGFAVSYYISHLLVKKSNDLGYLVGSRGSVGSSFVAWAMDITEVNALPPHYVCGTCKYVEWHDDGTIGSGYDLPRKGCPQCGAGDMYRDGQDIPFETFLGFKGDKVPDIDLNFSGDVQTKIQKFSEELLGGDKYVFKAGTVGTIAEKTAYGMVKGWLEDNNIVNVREAHVGYLASGVAGVKRTTGQHPGGMVVCPVGMEIEEVTPVQFPADDRNSGVKTTHFDYHAFESALMKLDILGHDDPTMLRMLQDLYRAKTGDQNYDIRTVAIDDPQVLRLFSAGGQEALGIESGKLMFDLGTIVLPEMGTRFVRQMLMETSPQNFSDLVRISGLSHGTDVWTNNAQDLIKKGICTLQTCIPTRDDIMLRLMYWGMEPALSFKIMESVRKGRGLAPDMEEAMTKAGVPEWYIGSCKTIKYMFPKAHAAAYVLSCLRIAWFKVHHPALFYATYFSVRAGSVDAELITKGPEAVRRYMQEVEAKGREASPKEKDSLTEYELVEEAFLRSIRFTKIELYRSEANRYVINPDGTLLCPFNSLAGLGDNAALAIVEARSQGEFQSIDDLKARARLNKSVIELLQNHGCLKGMPEGNQLVFSF